MARQSAARMPISTIWLLSVSRLNAAPDLRVEGKVSLVIGLSLKACAGATSAPASVADNPILLLQVGRRLHALLGRGDGIDVVPVDGARRAFDRIVLLPLVADHRR